MMNLSIAIVMEAYSSVMNKKEPTSNAMLAEQILEIESWMICSRQKKQIGYICFADYANETPDSTDVQMLEGINVVKEKIMKCEN
jgi:hypothetical protein